MAYEGYIDVVNNREVSGWIYDDANENEALSLEILAGDKVLATIKADGFRADLLAAGKGNGRHAFRYALSGNATGGGMPLSARVAGKRWHIQPTLSATGRTPPIQHDPRRKFLHTLEYGYPQVPTAFTEATRAGDEAMIAGRVVGAFHRALKDDPGTQPKKPDVFSEIQGAQHRDLLESIRRRDLAAVADYLRDAHARGIALGITQGADMTTALRADPDARRAVGAEYADNLASLAEFLGILDVESPSQRGRWGENLHADTAALADRISAAIGFRIETPPVIGSYFGIQTPHGIVTGRDLCALYAALQLRGLAQELSIASPVVCEIGGGLGAVAYYGAQMGFSTTIIDLPLVNALQGYFLLRALPEADIQLYGEQESPRTAIRILPPYAFEKPAMPFDLLLNQDAFPEMNAAHSMAYLALAKANVKHAFYSINHEARAPQTAQARQGVVRELVEQAGGFRLASRHRHWLRAGYVEEVYRRTGT